MDYLEAYYSDQEKLASDKALTETTQVTRMDGSIVGLPNTVSPLLLYLINNYVIAHNLSLPESFNKFFEGPTPEDILHALTDPDLQFSIGTKTTTRRRKTRPARTTPKPEPEKPISNKNYNHLVNYLKEKKITFPPGYFDKKNNN